MLAAFSFRSWNEEIQEMQRNLAIQASFAAKNSQTAFDNIGDGMDLLGRLLENINLDKEPELARGNLLEFQADHSEILAIAIISPEGKSLLSTDNVAGEAIQDIQPAYLRDFLFDLNNTYLFNIGRNQLNPSTGRWYFPFRHTVHDAHDKVQFVIQANISVESSTLLWSDLPLFPGSQVGLIRNDSHYMLLIWPNAGSGEIFSNPDTGALQQGLLANPAAISGTFEGKSPTENFDRIGAYSHLINANMSAFVSIPKKLILSRWWAHNYPVLLSFLVYLALIAIIALRLTTRERQHTQDLLVQSRMDPLTGLPNRIAIDEILAHELARDYRHEENSAILYLDLDKFKDINDTLGHSSGDLLLQLVALRLRKILRQEDVLARLGGDEFLAILPNSSAEKSSLAAQRIIDEFATPFHLSGQDFMISASIGICIIPDNGKGVGALLQNADAAMYEAKQHGRNRFEFYREELGARIHRRLELQQDILRALQQQEFVLHYQPLVDLRSGKVVAAEALVRWMDPFKGKRNPGEFIPFAEESGIILALGEWVLKTACRQARSWSDHGYDIRIAVNLSVRQFQDPELFAKISLALAETGLPPEKLELEITESAAMLDPQASIQLMDNLKALGVKIAIDDFGTGYSSLAYLKRIPADIIKIDRSFVNGIHEGQNDLAIVRAILALASSLDKHCLAEGIETAAQYETLLSLGCHFGQGFWFSQALPSAEFLALAANPLCAPVAAERAMIH